MPEVKATAGLRQLHTLFSVGTLGGLADQELLERFVSRRDEDAFATLVHRHAPMVLRVCTRSCATRTTPKTLHRLPS